MTPSEREGKERGVDALRELADPRSPLSDDAQRLAEALATPARPKTIEEALRMRHAPVIDLSALADDTIVLPFAPPTFVRPYLTRVPVPAKGREAKKQRLLADLRGASMFKRRAAALVSGSWPADDDIDMALSELVANVADPFASGLASCSLAAHRRLTPSAGVRLARRASEQAWDDDALGLALVGATAAVVGSRSRAARARLQDVLSCPVSTAALRQVQVELGGHLSTSGLAGARSGLPHADPHEV